jgi:hypothetical protein
VNTSSPIEGIAVSTADDNPHTIPSITSLGANRRAVFVLAVGESATLDATLSGGSGGDAAPTLVGGVSTTAGADRCLAMYSCAMTAAGTISGWQQTGDFTAAHAVFLGFFVKPTGS